MVPTSMTIPGSSGTGQKLLGDRGIKGGRFDELSPPPRSLKPPMWWWCTPPTA